MINNKFIKIAIVFLLLLSICIVCSAQRKVTLAGKVFKIGKFIADTVPTPHTYSYLGYPSSIRNSHFDLEIRCYHFGLVGQFTTLYSIKGNSDSLILEKDEFTTAPFHKAAVEVRGKSIERIYSLKRRAMHRSLVDSVLRYIINKGLFVQPDQHQTLKELQNEHVSLNKFPFMNDCCPDVFFEIKVCNRYKSFTYSPDPAEENLQIKTFRRGTQLFQIFNKLRNDMFVITSKRAEPTQIR